MQRVYVIQRDSWEYNDEYYYQGEDGGGQAILAFKDKDRAYKVCKEKNRTEIKRHLLGDSPGLLEFGYEADDVIKNREKFEKAIEKMGGTCDLDSREISIDRLTDDQVEELMTYINTEFYTVTEVDLDTWPERSR